MTATSVTSAAGGGRPARSIGRALTLAGLVGLGLAVLPLGPVGSRQAWAGREEPTARQALAEQRRRDGAGGAATTAKDEDRRSGKKRKAASTASTRGDPRFEAARRLYAEALGLERAKGGKPDPKRKLGFARVPDSSVLVLEPQAVAALLARRWQGAGKEAANPRRQTERMRTFVAIARALDQPPAVGALQASFGTPAENGLADLAGSRDQARQALAARPGDPDLAAAFHERERAFDTALANLPRGPKEGWALVDLDVNRDGRVDRADLERARAERDARKAPPVRSAAAREGLPPGRAP